MRILIADDDATSRVVAEVALRNLGHDCETVTDGVQAWNAFRSNPPDVVLSDWMMPGFSGLELCGKIREHATGSHTYFIMLTRHGDIDQILEGMSAGADDYLVKPLNQDDLHARLIAAARVTELHQQLAHQRDELQERNTELIVVARRDPLTGLRNRRALEEDLDLLEARVTRYGHQYCMAVLDIDHFKSYNDSYGHQAGDVALRAVAAALNAQVRGGDSLYRYGGEEFLCIFPEQSLATGAEAVERMRKLLEDKAIPHEGSPFGILTFSGGLAVLDSRNLRFASEVLKEADAGLYQAKRRGRNRVEHPVIYHA